MTVEVFPDGGMRESKDKKGSLQDVDLDFILEVFKKTDSNSFWTLKYVFDAYREKDPEKVISAISMFIEDFYEDKIGTSMEELIVHSQAGAFKYGSKNWEGLPPESFLDSFFRHYMSVVDGKSDENHKAAVIWNCMGLHYSIKKGLKK